MGYSKMELRNKSNPLLRRLQRQLDKKIKLKESYDKILKDKKYKKYKKDKKDKDISINLKDFDKDYEILSKVRKTKLGLYNKRGRR